jgi:hypothetical protein
MLLFIAALNELANGKGGFGLSPAQGLAFVRHAVPAGAPDMTYGNGLMHVGPNRALLHHTGGMVGFSSAFHLDPASGAGAFASANVGFGLEYRPRLLTSFAIQALASAARGQPLPAPKPLTPPLPAATLASLVGRYAGPGGSFEVRPGSPLTIVAGGQSAALQHWGGDAFRTTHPAYRAFTLLFERKSGKVTTASWGPASFVREGSGAQLAPSDPALARLAGRFTNDSPWWGTSLIVERGGRLWLGTDGALHKIGDNLWRVGDEAWSPERLSFGDFVDGQPQSVFLSGVQFERHDI